MASLSEFRQDLVSGDWVLFSTERWKRPNHDQKRERLDQSIEKCPFEDPQKSSNGQPILVYNQGQKVIWQGDFKETWTTQVIRNKFPALRQGLCGPVRQDGPFHITDANGFHELVITRDHNRSFQDFTSQETEEILKVYRERYLEISKDECGDYVSIFHNHGSAAGASIAHNHSQILSTPIIPPEVVGSLRGSMDYFAKHGKKVHDQLIKWEIDQAKRIVYQNEKFIAFCPFVSKEAYEMRIFPKESQGCFQFITDEDIPYCADVLNNVLGKLSKALDDPDYNFYIHTSPISDDVLVKYDFYHWHIEILPRISKIAGFELGTNIFINPVDPDDAAEHLRSAGS